MTMRQSINEAVTQCFAPMTSTVPRCHFVGATVSLTIVVLIVWVGSQRPDDVKTIQHGETEIDLNQATALIQNADEWRQLYTENYRRSQALAERISTIRRWLPVEVDWPSIEKEIRSFANQADLTITSLKQGKHHAGKRVGVLTATCQVQGSFPALARFLTSLNHRASPIACNEIVVHRDYETSNKLPRQTLRCRATVSLRIPYAATGTTAAELFATEANHET